MEILAFLGPVKLFLKILLNNINSIQLDKMARRSLLSLFKCSFLETAEMRFDVRMAETAISFKKMRVHLLKI